MQKSKCNSHVYLNSPVFSDLLHLRSVVETLLSSPPQPKHHILPPKPNLNHMKKSTALLLLCISILLVVCAVRAINNPRPVGPDEVRFDTFGMADNSERCDDYTPDTKVEYQFLGVFKYHSVEYMVTSLMFLRYPTLTAFPVVSFTKEGTTNDVVIFDEKVTGAESICWTICLLSVLIVFICALGVRMRLWPLMIYASGFSLFIIIARHIASTWYPGVFLVTGLCIAVYFTLPFIFCLQLARFMPMSRKTLYIILGVFFAAYLAFAYKFSYLYHDMICLILCVAPSTAIFWNKPLKGFVIMYLLPWAASIIFIADGFVITSNQLTLPLFLWSLLIGVAMLLACLITKKTCPVNSAYADSPS